MLPLSANSIGLILKRRLKDTGQPPSLNQLLSARCAPPATMATNPHASDHPPKV